MSLNLNPFLSKLTLTLICSYCFLSMSLNIHPFLSKLTLILLSSYCFLSIKHVHPNLKLVPSLCSLTVFPHCVPSLCFFCHLLLFRFLLIIFFLYLFYCILSLVNFIKQLLNIISRTFSQLILYTCSSFLSSEFVSCYTIFSLLIFKTLI